MSEGPTVALEVVRVGEVPMPHAYVYRPAGGLVTRLASLVRPDGDKLRAPLLWYAIRHPSAGTVLIDTGLHPDALRDLRSDYGLAMSLLFRGLRPASQSFEEQLRGLEISPEAVELVVMTHLHVDHTSGMRLLANAEFVCAREEWAAATGSSAGANGYVSGHLPPAERTRLVDFEAEGEAHGPFSRTIDLLGDGSVRLLSTPGHTRGHLSLLLRGDGGEVLVIGDAVYTLRSLREELLPLRTAGDRKYMRSLREIKAYAEQHPEAVLVPTHDPDAWRALRREVEPAASYTT